MTQNSLSVGFEYSTDPNNNVNRIVNFLTRVVESHVFIEPLEIIEKGINIMLVKVEKKRFLKIFFRTTRTILVSVDHILLSPILVCDEALLTNVKMESSDLLNCYGNSCGVHLFRKWPTTREVPHSYTVH